MTIQEVLVFIPVWLAANMSWCSAVNVLIQCRVLQVVVPHYHTSYILLVGDMSLYSAVNCQNW